MTTKTDDDKYIRRGVFLATPQLFTSWDDELARMNQGKRGGPYEYPDSLIQFAANVKDYAGIASRVLEGFLLALSAYVPNVKRCDHTTICRRINEFSKALKNHGGSTIAIDSSGLTPARRGGWLSFKHRKKQPYVKIHLAVDVRDGKIRRGGSSTQSVFAEPVFGVVILRVYLAKTQYVKLFTQQSKTYRRRT